MVKHLQTQAESLYGLPQPTVNQFPTPVVARRDPTTSDTGYIFGQIWVNRTAGTIFALASNAGGIATWLSLGGSFTPSVVNVTVTGTATSLHFRTSTAATATDLTGNIWSAIGTDAAINLVLTPKGAGGVTVTSGALTLTAGDITTTLGNILATQGNITATLGNIVATQGNITATLGDITATNGNIIMGTAGKGLRIKTGANARMGTSAAMVAGVIAVANTSVTANTVVFLSPATTGGAQGALSVVLNAGVGFTINSSSATDTSTVNWLLIEAI